VLIGLLLLLLIPAIGTPLYFAAQQSGGLQPAGSSSAVNTQAAISMPLLPQEPAGASSAVSTESVAETAPLTATADNTGEPTPVESITLGQPLPTETLMLPEPTPVESRDRLWLQEAPDSEGFHPDSIETTPENKETLVSDEIPEDNSRDDTLLSEERIVSLEDNSQEPLWKWVV
jgi:hypothetical protein